MPLVLPVPDQVNAKGVTCYGPDGSINEGPEVPVSGGVLVPKIIYRWPWEEFGYQTYAGLWCNRIEKDHSLNDVLPSIEFALQLSVQGTAEPVVYGTWKVPDYGTTGLVAEVQGTRFDTLALWARLPAEFDKSAHTVWAVRIATDKIGGRPFERFGQFTVPGK